MADFEQPSQSSIESATRGDPTAIADVLRAYLPRLQHFVRVRLGARLRDREDSIDIVQSTVRELLADQGFEWRGEVEFRAWLFQAALNKIRAKARYHAADKRTPDREAPAAGSAGGALDAVVADQPTPSRVAMAREEVQRLEAVLAELSEPQREVLTLSRIVGLPHAVIAQQLGKSEVAVRQLLVRAMASLGARMGDS
ncbi:MAG: sigma-70 family RNA polymerase sigma factor [Planctomycetes bacterium]|nr:sigma-70 family RNA polymerase sigma factor [Planctomycetota bacterium]